MVFNRKGSFFLNLDEKAPTAPATVAPVAKPEAKAAAKPESAAQTAVAVNAAAAATPAAAAPSSAATPSGNVLTTAEAIAAELAAEQAAKPATTYSTFAPECVTAGGALPMRRRRSRGTARRAVPISPGQR